MLSEKVKARVLSINNGYRNYKSVDGEIFTSKCEVCADDAKTSADKIKYGNVTYVVGSGKANLESDKTLTDETKILILNMCCRQMDSNKEKFKLMLSCPPKFHQDQSNSLPDYLIGKHKLTWNTQELVVEIEDVAVLPETFITYPINNVDSRYDDKIVLIIDVGGFTTNVCRVRFGEYGGEDDFFTIKHGMYHLDFEVCSYLNSQYTELECTEEEMYYYRKVGLNINGEEVDILEVEKNNIENIYCKFIDEIIEKCKLKKWNYTAYEPLVTGGGGEVLYKTIKEHYLRKAKLSEDPLFDNFNGLEYYQDMVYGESNE